MTIYFYKTKQKYGCFSNFSRHVVALDGHVWLTSEHYFQAQKFLADDLQAKVRKAKSPGEAASIGRNRSNPLRLDWEQVKDDVMRRAVLAKFKQNKDIKKVLLGTGNEYLVEDSPIDSYWGCGPDKKGKNMLGRILMEVREQLCEPTQG